MSINIKMKGYVYTELAEVIKSLERKITLIEEDARDDLTYCMNEETGEIDETHWRYETRNEKLDHVDGIKTLIAMLEKM